MPNVEFIVNNTGDGIASEYFNKIFTKFSRLNGNKSTANKKGTGLGLFISKKIIQAHGGSISVESDVGAWTEFRLSTLLLYLLPTLPTSRLGSKLISSSSL